MVKNNGCSAVIVNKTELLVKFKSILYLVCQSQMVEKEPLKSVKAYLIDTIHGVYGMKQSFSPSLKDRHSQKIFPIGKWRLMYDR